MRRSLRRIFKRLMSDNPKPSFTLAPNGKTSFVKWPKPNWWIGGGEIRPGDGQIEDGLGMRLVFFEWSNGGHAL
jgi:hypothetical protein